MGNRDRKFQCPECRSHYTQTVSLAYSQSVRTGYNGNQTISAFGAELQPPEARSELLVPLAYAATMFLLTFFFLPYEITWMSFGWLQIILETTSGRLGFSTGVALAVLIYSSGRAIAHNATVHAAAMEEWGQTMICRRCGVRF